MARDQIGYSTGVSTWTTFFNIFINDLLLAVKESELCNFADDTEIVASCCELQVMSLYI